MGLMDDYRNGLDELSNMHNRVKKHEESRKEITNKVEIKEELPIKESDIEPKIEPEIEE